MTPQIPTAADWARVKLLATDVDGVLTDGTVLYGPQGELAKNFFIRDGMGLRLLEAAGVRVAIITSEDSPSVRARVERLMLSAYRPGMKRKGEALKALMREYDAAPAETVFVGDDVNDAEALKIAGLPCTPADGTEFARHNARYVTLAPAGRGAIREIADRILAARGLDAAALWAGLHPRAEVRDAGSV